MKYNFYIILAAIMLFSCDPPPCEVEYYELEPIKRKLFQNTPDSTLYFHELLLKELFVQPFERTEKVLVTDSLVDVIIYDTLYSCNLNVSGSLKKINTGDIISFGSSEAGGLFSKLKLRLDKVNINSKTVDVTIWKIRFVQDCSNWSD